MKTSESIEKLNCKARDYCELLSSLIESHRSLGRCEYLAKDSGKLRGYLQALEDVGIISSVEKKQLYLWYFEKNRRK